MRQRANKIKDNECVLDVGCGSGYLAEFLIKNKNCSVVGLESNESLAAIARKHIKVYVQDLEIDGVDNISERFDVVVLGDIIEHLRYDKAIKLLKDLKKLLKPGGRIVISTPNFVHIKNRIRVLFGRFDYRESGLLDRTHVHFYTKNSIDKLMNDTGYSATDVDYTTGFLDLDSLKNKLFYIAAKLWPNLFAYQYLIVAKPV